MEEERHDRTDGFERKGKIGGGFCISSSGHGKMIDLGHRVLGEGGERASTYSSRNPARAAPEAAANLEISVWNVCNWVRARWSKPECYLEL